ncbi:MAG TPA: FAD-dependent oxidoreductase [Pseudonocardiaceae bacterium]|jgi:pyruvate/2-oxoglutarate dehydrogenase complex dihydrolipoamide dehydrogenase (E3) component|nr:FAD-dependent oxidoreductase [Pseudonocardiaceae bacterium]
MVSAHEKMFAESGMDFVLGTAHFVGPRTAEVRTRNGDIRRIRGDNVVINTGTGPAVPALPGIGEADVWASETILKLDRLPARLSILGGGYVG